jgi:hypothetical protein
MAEYQIIATAFPLVVRTADNVVVSNVATHPDRVAYNEWLLAGNLVDAFPVTVPPVAAKAQFYMALKAAGVLTENQAIQAMNGNLPNVIDGMIDLLPAAQRFRAKMFFRSELIWRRDPLIAALQAATGRNMDDLFRQAESL